MIYAWQCPFFGAVSIGGTWLKGLCYGNMCNMSPNMSCIIYYLYTYTCIWYVYIIYIYIYILLYYICTEYHALTVRQIVCMCVIDSFATPNPQVVDGYRFCLIDACRSTLIHPLLSMCYLLWMQSIYECHALSHHSLVLQVCCDGKDSSFFFNSLASPGQQF